MTHEQLSQALRRLPKKLPPAGLRMQLRVVASKERQLRGLTRWERVRAWFDEVQFRLNNAMRPFAIPAAGGLFSAVALFSTWVVPTYPLRAVGADIPTMLTTEAAIRGTMQAGLGSDGIAIVDVTVDEQGRMVDYKVVAGAAALANGTIRRRLENTLLFTEFIPATTFGQPMTQSVVRVSIDIGNNSRIEVRG
jgi:hypothetical protein